MLKQESTSTSILIVIYLFIRDHFNHFNHLDITSSRTGNPALFSSPPKNKMVISKPFGGVGLHQFYCVEFSQRKNVRPAIRKTPKVYLWDWSMIKDSGNRAENFVVSHLLKAVHYWTDIGLGEYGLFYVRDKLKREVDILVGKNNRPWFLVKVKETRNKGISKALHYYHHELKTEHAFQVVLDMPFVEADCFQHSNPVIVPTSTFLSQRV